MINRLLFIVGTRPEAIKLAPVIAEVVRQGEHPIVLATNQHDNIPHILQYNFNLGYLVQQLPEPKRDSLSAMSSSLIDNINKYISSMHDKPTWIIVQGDTASTFAGSVVGFYNGIRVAHIEAGLRSCTKFQPFPEECHRRLIATTADYHFCPLPANFDALIKEGVSTRQCFVTGNTVVDALTMVVNDGYEFQSTLLHELTCSKEKIVVLTMHRRENWYLLEDIFHAIKGMIQDYTDVHVVFPVHPNYKVRDAAKVLHDTPNISLVDPIDYKEFANLMAKSYLIVTDSGGIQEEATYLNVPTIVVRRQTERQEGVLKGVAKLVGVNPATVADSIKSLLFNEVEYKRMTKVKYNDIYGPVGASQHIVSIISRHKEVE